MTKKDLKHRPVIEIQRGRDISQEPEMEQLTRLYADMTEREQERALDHLAACGRRGGEGAEKPNCQPSWYLPFRARSNKKSFTPCKTVDMPGDE